TAMHFRSGHAVAAVDAGFDGVWKGVVEARPAGAAFELERRSKQLLPATGTGKSAGPVFVEKRAATGGLGAMGAHDPVLLGRKQPHPFRVGARHLVSFGIHLVLLS